MMPYKAASLTIQPWARRPWIWLSCGILLAVYLALFILFPRGVFYSPDSGGKYMQMLGYQRAGGLECELIYPGEVSDPEYHFYGSHAGREALNTIYPYRMESGETGTGWTPWFSLFSLPFHQAFGFSGLYVLPWIAGLILIGVASVLAERLRPGIGPLVAILVGLGSPVLFYSLCFWEHTLAVALALAALLPFVRMDSGEMPPSIRPFQWALSGILMLAACVLRRELIIFLGAAVLVWGYLFSRRRHVLILVFLAVLALGLGGGLLLYLFPSSFQWLFPSGIENLEWVQYLGRLDLWRKLIFNTVHLLLVNDFTHLLPLPVLVPGLLGLAVCLGSFVVPRSWRWGMVLMGATLLSVPAAWLVMTSLRYRALNSLLMPSPLVALALLPSRGPSARLRRWLGGTIALFLGTIYLLLSAAGTRHGGIEWGSRYALLAIVLLMVLAVVAVRDLWTAPNSSRQSHWMVGGLTIWLILLGVGSASRGVQELWRTRRDLLQLQTTLECAGNSIVTDTWWVGAALAPFAIQHEIYTLSKAHPIQEWVETVGPNHSNITYVGAFRSSEPTAAIGRQWRQRDSESVAGLSIQYLQKSSAP